ncbi:TIGR02391 family protein [Lactobacillus sp. CC-MHH1034]|uniref:TIGR02391 family protein n=1 Tax=Agrilactobacillus fermenti TaxID=2586909 RepID=UPI001E6058DB|nr:TIGR02391 family protein [Agrilactobacillus fermenti]MCD2257402.1 TIGR02391 family protein [Agrilactobacillus fermenti]
MTKSIDNTVIENISKVLGEYTTGGKITSMFHALKLVDFDETENRGITTTKWRRLNESITYKCSITKNAKPFFETIEYIMRPQNFLDKPNVWHNGLHDINAQLIFYGYELTDAGKIVHIKSVSSFSDAQNRLKSFSNKLDEINIHPEVKKYCQKEFLEEDYFHAVFEASKGLLQRVRNLSELSEDGQQLIDVALNRNRPVILIKGNKLETKTELSQYNGLKELLKAIIFLYRNPQAHIPKLYDSTSVDDAVSAFSVISVAQSILDKCINVRNL